MKDRRKELSDKLYGDAPVEEQVLVQLTVERICADMANFFTEFYNNYGPGAIVYSPQAKEEKNTMFYLTVDQLIAAQEDLRKEDMDGPCEVMQKAVAKAESLNVQTQALFIINDQDKMALLLYDRNKPVSGPVKA